MRIHYGCFSKEKYITSGTYIFFPHLQAHPLLFRSNTCENLSVQRAAATDQTRWLFCIPIYSWKAAKKKKARSLISLLSFVIQDVGRTKKDMVGATSAVFFVVIYQSSIEESFLCVDGSFKSRA